MSEYTSIQNEMGQRNESYLTLVANTLNQLSNNSRKFNLSLNDDTQALSDYLSKESSSRLIIKIIGTSNEQIRYSMRASIQNAFKLVLRTLMEQTNICLLTSTRAILDLEEYDKKLEQIDDKNPYIVTCEPFGKSQLFMYHPRAYRYIDKILFQIQQTTIHIPIIVLLIEGDTLSITNILENIANNIPTIILKGTGLIANQLAELYQPMEYGFKKPHERLFTEQMLNERDLRRLNPKNTNNQSFIFVCQPGKDKLDECLLQTIGVAMRIIDQSHAHIVELNFAMEWNKIKYTQRHILNYNTIIDWTNEELDKCLEMAILLNAVSFVELLFEYGASLQRLPLISSFDTFKLKPLNRRSKIKKENELVELMIEASPVVTELDSDKRIKVYLRHLFCWTVENQYFDLIMSICTRLEDSIIGILLVSQWCKYKEHNDYITSINYRNYSRQFQIYAADILDRYYADNEEKTIKLLDEKSILYPEQQISILIDDLCSKSLVSTNCMQSYMNKIWYGEQFHTEKTFIWEILICLVCCCPLLLFIPIIRNRIFQSDKNEHINKRNTFWNRISYQFKPFQRFYQGNAVIRFHYNMVSYAIFLILFSYVILFDYFPLNIYNEKRSNISRLPIPLTEIILHIFIASIGLEELRQVYLHIKSNLIKSPYWKTLFEINRHRNTIWAYFKNDPWNILDLIAFTLWIIGFITRFIVHKHAFEVSKICMSLDLCLWYMRCLHIFLASERLGPKLLMIFHTMKDLMSFLFFILIFLFAYAITTYSLISTSSLVNWSNSTYFTTIQNVENLTGMEILRNIIEWGTWKIFGSASLTTSDSVQIKYSVKNDGYGFVTLLLTITFIVIAYVLLLNNLIALFNFTIQRVYGQSHQAWCYPFYVVLKEYEDKNMFIPPLNLLLFPISYYMRKNTLNHRKKNEVFVDRDKKQFQRYQQRIAEKYWKEKQINENRLINQQSYVCRECQSRRTEVDYNESTFL